MADGSSRQGYRRPDRRDKKYNVGCVLSGNPLADGAVAGVVVDWIVIRVGVYMVAPS